MEQEELNELNMLRAENAKMREALLIIAESKGVRGNKVAWHMTHLAAEALAKEEV